MDKIFSRKRIKIPKIKCFRYIEKNKNTKLTKTSLIIMVAVLTEVLIIRALNPMFNTMCLEKAKGIATDILNVESSKVLKDVDYEDLVSILRDSNRTDYNAKD